MTSTTLNNKHLENTNTESASAHKAVPIEIQKTEDAPAIAKINKPLGDSPQALWFKNFLRDIIPPILGIILFIFIWGVIANRAEQLPNPQKTWLAAVELFKHPFYLNDAPEEDIGGWSGSKILSELVSNPINFTKQLFGHPFGQHEASSQGIGWNLWDSLLRVGMGFSVAVIIGVPLGFIIGRFKFMSQMLNPIISVLRPVSPLIWLPIGIVIFEKSTPAALWVIFITSIWPIILNTASGVGQVPQDYLNVARVLRLSEWNIMRKILLPAVLPYILTGIRLALGMGWLVIVAAEMLSGSSNGGIGAWVWNEYNNFVFEHMIIAVFVVGAVGLLLDQVVAMIGKRYQY